MKYLYQNLYDQYSVKAILGPLTLDPATSKQIFLVCLKSPSAVGLIVCRYSNKVMLLTETLRNGGAHQFSVYRNIPGVATGEKV